jgi:hypothetical protein
MTSAWLVQKKRREFNMKAHWISLALLSLQLIPLACHADYSCFEQLNADRQLFLAQDYTPGQPIKLHDYSHSSQSSPASQSPSFSGANPAQNNSSEPASSFSTGTSSGNNDRLPDLIPPMPGFTQPDASSNNASNHQTGSANSSSAAAVNIWSGSSNSAPGSSSSSPGSTNSPTGSSTNLAPVPSLPADTTSSASTDIPPTDKKKERPPKAHSGSGLSSKIKHFAGGVIQAAPEVLTGASQGYVNGGGGGMPYQPGNSPGGNSNADDGGYGGGSSGDKRAQLLNGVNFALAEEKRGEYDAAAGSFWGVCDSAIGGLGYKERTDFWENGNIGPYKCRDLYRHALSCHVILYRNYLEHGPSSGTIEDEQGHATCLFKDFTCLNLTDVQNASWYYLHALNDIAVDKQELAHARAFWLLGICEHCKNCNAELKNKCEVLRDHIRLAGVLELADENRAKFANMAAFVWGHEHPTVNIYTDSSGNVTHVVGSGGGPLAYYYPLMKEMLKNDFPKFQADYNRLVAYIRSLPNHAVAIPPGDGSPEIVAYKIRQNEEKSYGPVVYRTNGHF